MSVPRGISTLASLEITPEQPLFRSYIFLFGIIPFDYSDLTLITLEDGLGFVEQSPMGSMTLWRHERWIRPAGSGCIITDRLTFEPRFARTVTQWFVHRLFSHRHAVLRRHLRRA